MKYLILLLSFFTFAFSATGQDSLKHSNDTLYQEFQISFLPGLSSNGVRKQPVVNRVSLNVLGGYSDGLRGVEFGGLFNIVDGHARWLQGAGLFNTVNGPFEGLQGAGILNYTKTINGFQAAGLANINLKEAHGFQAAGSVNISQSMNGFQAAGLANLVGDTVRGFQAAGILNIARYAEGVQASGMINSTSSIDGVQIAGLLNTAKTVRGSQIGFINIADSVSGVSVGFLSIVKKGYHKLEIGADEVMPIRASIRTGTRKFYNIFLFGIRPSSDQRPLWTIGYGIGSSLPMSKKLYLDFDLTSSHLSKGYLNTDLHMYNQLYIGLEWQMAPKFALAFGPTINLLLSDSDDPEYLHSFSKIRPSYLFNDRIYDDVQMMVWFGGRVALRMF